MAKVYKVITREERLELVNKIGTQIDGAESYLMKLKNDGSSGDLSASTCIMEEITFIREMLQLMEDAI